jgi:hypothetical protein
MAGVVYDQMKAEEEAERIRFEQRGARRNEEHQGDHRHELRAVLGLRIDAARRTLWGPCAEEVRPEREARCPTVREVLQLFGNLRSALFASPPAKR